MTKQPKAVLAFCLYRYFPHGGLQRDMRRIALACRQRGYAVVVYTTAWDGDIPEGFELHVRRPSGWTNHRRMQSYHRWVTSELSRRGVTCVIGFNKMDGLDLYYAADGCLQAKVLREHPWLHRLMPRYRLYLAFEEAVFGRQSKTHILMISAPQKSLYAEHYGTPEDRIHFLPPNVAPSRFAGPDAPQIRQTFRRDSALRDEDRLVLQLGSDFRRKGLDRSLRALASLPKDLLARTQLHVVGEGSTNHFARLARRLGVADHVMFLGARDDVPRMLLGADLLVHPAYHENTGTVLVEALASGLPVIASAACGYAHYIEEAQAGWVVPEPFDQVTFNDTLRQAIESEDLQSVGRRGAVFAQNEDLQGMVETSVAVIEKIAATVKS